MHHVLLNLRSHCQENPWCHEDLGQDEHRRINWRCGVQPGAARKKTPKQWAPGSPSVIFVALFCWFHFCFLFFLNRKKNESFDFLGCFGQTIFLFGKPTVFPRRIRVHSVCSWWMLWSAYDTMSRRCEIQRPCSWGLESLPFSFHWMFLDRKKSWKVIVGSKWLVLTYPYFLDLSSKNPIHSHLNKKSTGRTTQASKNFGLDVKFWPKRPEVKGGRNGAFTLMACRTCLNLWWFQVNASQISAKQLGEECKNSRISILQIFQVFV